MSRLSADPRIDPRIKTMFGALPDARLDDVADRAALLAEQAGAPALAVQARMRAFLDTMDCDAVAPAAGLETSVLTIISAPDGNVIPVHVVRPADAAGLPGIVFLHGGAMQSGSCASGNYRAWARMIAAQGAVVAMIDFRNAVHPSSVPEVAPFPAGLNDCVSGLRWVSTHAAELGADPSRIVLSGDSGGANLAFATALCLQRAGDLDRVAGLYAFCPFIAGSWPQADCPSSVDNNGIILELHSNRYAIAYGIDELERKNPLAWPYSASAEDLAGLPPTMISVNECDPLRDEGVNFYRRLRDAGVSARCQQVMGTVHDIEVLVTCCPEISLAGARSLAAFAASEGIDPAKKSVRKLA